MGCPSASTAPAILIAASAKPARRHWRGGWASSPATDARLVELARSGIDSVDVVCPGFAVDCLETREEIALQDTAIYRDAGGAELRYITALNDGPGHVAALAAIARRHLHGWPE